ncbi:uncharacterized protein LOC128963959 [Oppia nitens]|uniref:uncharacterized protein LOC128963959 n=1 Tax=Oppia nitens TaxID=1686743 RepID=UPI0023DA4FCD|nr:uncharacterized protein LOC128963959 [Oppia nitens]XP_054166486.1 uncharacterized protein LOC128963959 [Oppia nitens]XP_054166487.1 uncharacterized protein LOC128963959 [Oppia nitens]
MASDQSFSYRLVKIALILLNALVIIGLTLSLLLMGHHMDPPVVIFVLIIESNFVAAIVGAIRESRPLVLTTGSVTLIMLLLASFGRTDRSQNATFSMLYFLAIVMLSYAFSAMLKDRQNYGRRSAGQQRGVRTQITGAADNQSRDSSPFAAVVVYHPPPTVGHLALPMSTSQSTSQELSNIMKDPPPPYDDCPPPKYEDITNNHKPV